ncbi:MAG: hypothetical protein HYT83_01540 [Candidatus Levybacteria bacterium]|nr:hypothetical protein [Candidatus Levybacteria bacterium]
MKRISILLAGLIFVFIFELLRSPSEINNTISPLSLSPVPSLTAAQATSSTSATETTSLFVPYWGLGLQKIKSDDYNQLIYFGVTVNNQGIDTTEYN